MKRIIAFFLCVVLSLTSLFFSVSATNEDEFSPYVIDFTVTTEINEATVADNARATGLITAYGLSLSNSGTTLKLSGQTHASAEVEKCGFKNLVVERRKTSSDSWEEYYDFGNVYVDGITANLSTNLAVASGYQYRISCKHYAKKNILSVQTISNTSNSITL